MLFSQEGVGLDGVPFPLLKLRSLRPADEGESQTRWSAADDERVGPVGRVQRRTSLDRCLSCGTSCAGEILLRTLLSVVRSTAS